MKDIFKNCSEKLERILVHLLDKEEELFVHESRGNDFPDKHFLIIRRKNAGTSGLFSFFFTNLCMVWYAYEHGMIPIIDMKTDKNLYQRPWIDWRKTNTWELFFEQPDAYSLSDVEGARNITVVTQWRKDIAKLPVDIWDNSNEANEHLKALRDFVAKHFRVKETCLQEFINEKFESEVGNGIIGVFARGTDYLSVRPKGSTVQPTAQMVIEKVMEYSEKGHQEEKIYLVTEDRSIAGAFKAAFGERLLLSRQDFVDYKGDYLGRDASIKGNLKRGYGYLKAIIDLSRCRCLIAGRANGALGAMLLSSGYEYTYFFDLGSYE